MVFSSVTFIFLFLPVTLAGYYLLRKRYDNLWLLGMSLLFFSWAMPRYLPLILFSIAINYFSGIIIHVFRKYPAGRKAALAGAVIANLSLLFYFKYYDFFIGSIDSLLNISIPLKNIILPIGISFFTFQGMSYVIDVYREDVSVQNNPVNLALYIALFPQLIAGPIVRYNSIAAELEDRNESREEFEQGIDRFIIGLSKKAIIANSAAVIADSVWGRYSLHNTPAIAWLGSIAYTLQIYYDFSGYSDMAIGLGQMFGFHFPENFRYPYVSKTVSEFWRRWHISLSGWFRDYLYIPLGGSRRHLYRNLAIVFLITGLWHGAAWHYVVWGIFHGALILMERRFGIRERGSESKGLSAFLFHVYTLLAVNFGWVLFRADSMRDAIRYLGNMFGVGLPAQPGFKISWYLNRWSILILVLAVLGSTQAYKKIFTLLHEKIRFDRVSPDLRSTLVKLLYLFLFIYSIMRIVAGTYNPFIYFQF